VHTIKITPNLPVLFGYQCTSGKFIRLPNRIEKIDSVARIESKLFFPELECSNTQTLTFVNTDRIRITHSGATVSVIVGYTLRGLLPISLLAGEQRHDGCEQFA